MPDTGMIRQTLYAKSGDATIAYQVSGEGPIDLVYAPGWISNVEYGWENPDFARFFTRLSSFCRLIMFDKRGTGLSDREVGFPTLEQRTDDIRAVMDAAGSEKATLFGVSEGGNMSALFAATYPERTQAVILYGSGAKGSWAPDYPWRMNEEEIEDYLAEMERNWGLPFDLRDAAPSVADDEAAQKWFAAYLRYSASPPSAKTITRLNFSMDIREVLPSVRAPTLVLCRQGDRWANIEEARYLAAHVPEAKLVELPGEDRLPWWGGQDEVVAEIQEFVTGTRENRSADRVLVTILMTDIVASPAKARVPLKRLVKSGLNPEKSFIHHNVSNRYHFLLYS